MPRIRTIKPEIWTDEALGGCPLGARLLYIGMITQADDEGRLRAAPALLRSVVFPYDAKVTPSVVSGWLEALVQAGLVRCYEVSGEVFADIPSWSKHQTINRPRDSHLPAFQNRRKPEQNPPFAGDSVNDHGAITELSLSPHGRKGREGKGKEKHVQLSDDAAKVWSTYRGYHPKAALSATGKNNRKGIIERALKLHDADTCVAAIHGIHASDYHVSNGYAGDLELTLRDADHIEKYAALHSGTNGKPQLTAEDYDRIAAEREAAAQRRREQRPAEEEIPF